MINSELSKYIGKTSKYIGLGIFARWLRLLCNIGFAFIFAYLLERLISAGEIQNIPAAVLATLAIACLKYFLAKWIAFENSKVVDEVKLNLRKSVYQKILDFGTSYTDQISTAKSVQLGVENVEQLETYYGGYITQFYYSFIAAITLFLTIAPYDLKIGAVILVISFVIPMFLTVLLNMVRKVQKKYWKSYGDVGALFLDSLQGLTTLKVFGADEARAAEMDKKAEYFRNDTMRVLRTQLNSINVVDLLCYGGAAAAVILAVSGVAGGRLDLFSGILIIILSAEFFIPMRQLTAFFHVAMGGVAAGEQILEFLKREVPIYSGKAEFAEFSDITTKKLRFSYSEDKDVLKDISIKVKKSGMVALVGVSGCGKSTLASILAGELPVQDGMVFYGDADINSIDRAKLTSAVTRISHSGYLFRGDVRSNLLMGKSDASDEMMIDALKEVNLWEFLESVRGLDTKIASGGVNLSGGQAQRLSLARALLHDSKVYIFDEAASNVDMESEEIILKTIANIAKTKTVIYISHRLRSIVASDNIYVFDSGKIVEEGTHEQLMQQGGVYSALFKEQEELENFRDASRRQSWKK